MLKYNRQGGHAEVSCDADGDALCVSVTDTGLGLSDDERSRLFQTFERLHADKTAIPDAGIGLPLSKRLVEAMHGDIGVSSNPGVVSTFCIRLPRAKAADMEVATAAASQLSDPGEATPVSAASARTVLYIEDDPARGAASGFAAYVIKPLDLARLLAATRRTLETAGAT